MDRRRTVFVFGPSAEFEFDENLIELRRSGVAVGLEPKPLELLRFLLQNHERTVTKEEILDAVWPDTVVGDASLSRALSQLRDALGDDPSNPALIQTLRRRGYRVVTAVDEREIEPAAPRPLAARRSGWMWAAAAAVVAFVVWGVWSSLRPPPPRSTPSSEISLAVLPFRNHTEGPSPAYFADGMTGALINELSVVRAIRVISRPSAMEYKGTDKEPIEIASELGVNHLLTGAVSREGGEIRVEVELFDVAARRVVWRETYTRPADSVIALHREIANSIADEVHAELSNDEERRLAHAHPVASEAYEAYLRANFVFTTRYPDRYAEALALLDEAIEAEPTWADPWGLKAQIWMSGAFQGLFTWKEVIPKAEAAALRALERDPENAEAYFALGEIRYAQFEWEATERAQQRGRELNPNHAPGHFWSGMTFAALRRFPEAIAMFERAKALNPLDPVAASGLGRFYFRTGRHAEGQRVIEDALALNPDHPFLLITKKWQLFSTGHLKESLRMARELVERHDGYWMYRLHLAQTLAFVGQREEALSTVEEVVEDLGPRVNAFEVAVVYVGLGDLETALDWLERAWERRQPSILNLAEHEWPGSIQTHPRFVALLEALKLDPSPFRYDGDPSDRLSADELEKSLSEGAHLEGRHEFGTMESFREPGGRFQVKFGFGIPEVTGEAIVRGDHFCNRYDRQPHLAYCGPLYERETLDGFNLVWFSGHGRQEFRVVE